MKKKLTKFYKKYAKKYQKAVGQNAVAIAAALAIIIGYSAARIENQYWYGGYVNELLRQGCEDMGPNISKGPNAKWLNHGFVCHGDLMVVPRRFFVQ